MIDEINHVDLRSTGVECAGLAMGEKENPDGLPVSQRDSGTTHKGAEAIGVNRN